jgi:PilZ domain
MIMQRFRYRGARFPVDVFVDFIVKDTTIAGRCTEISKEGMKLELRQPVARDSSGRISMRFQGRKLEFSVRVVHSDLTNCGVEFLTSESDQIAVAQLVELLVVPRNRRGPILMKIS